MTKRALPERYTVRPDSKGRITIGKHAAGVSSFEVEVQEDGVLRLVPMVEVPAKEAWLFRNDQALASVRRGLAESAAGDVVERGSFSQYLDSDES